MARMTRSQRRARRQAQAASEAGQSNATARAAQIRPQAPAKTQTGARRKEEKGGPRRLPLGSTRLWLLARSLLHSAARGGVAQLVRAAES